MNASDSILREVMLGLRTTGEGVAFEQPPRFLVKRIKALPADQQRETVRSLAAFGYVLEQKQNAPEASRTLMRVLEEVVKDLSQEGGRG